MKKILRLAALTSVILVSACATQTGWTPTIDYYGDPNAARINQDMAECRQLALSASGGTATETAKGVGVGALIGAAGGAAMGAITGNPATGAAIGATVGGIGGGSKEGLNAESAYKRAYINCLRNRGHNVVN